MGDHAKVFPPSASAAWMQCPAYAPGSGSGTHAEFGTLCHDYAEKALKGDLSLFDTPDAVRVVITEYVTYCLDTITWADKYVIEGRFDIPTTGEFGTCDLAALYSENWGDTQVLEVIDLKTGSSHVKADNPQMRLYALGAAHHFQVNDPNTKILLTIVQRKHKRSHELTLAELNEWEQEELSPAVTRRLEVLQLPIEQQYPLMQHGWGTCFWCENKGTCLGPNYDVIEDF